MSGRLFDVRRQSKKLISGGLAKSLPAFRAVRVMAGEGHRLEVGSSSAAAKGAREQLVSVNNLAVAYGA